MKTLKGNMNLKDLVSATAPSFELPNIICEIDFEENIIAEFC